MIDLLGLSQMFVEVSDKILPLFASRNHKTKTQSNFFYQMPRPRTGFVHCIYLLNFANRPQLISLFILVFNNFIIKMI